MANRIVTEAELTGVANHIRGKTGGSAPLTWPGGFEGAVDAIQTSFPPLQNQAGAGDVRYGKSAYDGDGNQIDGSLRDIHRPIPLYWDNANAKFSMTADYLAFINATLAADGAVTGYLVNSETGVPMPCEFFMDGNNLVLTGGIVVVDGSDTDRYVLYANIAQDGTISNEKCYLIRLAVTVSRHISDWMADGDYLSCYIVQ